jgi:2-hydroxychromene-2-carboxylate isomerase
VNDDSPKVERVDFLTTHLGQERFAKLKNDVSKWAEEKGIPMLALLDNPIPITNDFCHRSFKGVVSQTTRAHRLCQKAYKMGGQKLQIPILCAVFKAHMEDGLDIANIGVLADLAESVGLMGREEVHHFWCEFTWVLT